MGPSDHRTQHPPVMRASRTMAMGTPSASATEVGKPGDKGCPSHDGRSSGSPPHSSFYLESPPHSLPMAALRGAPWTPSDLTVGFMTPMHSFHH